MDHDKRTMCFLCIFSIPQDAVSPVWEQKCLQAFHSSAPGTELDACLWSLTEVLKGLLKRANRGK